MKDILIAQYIREDTYRGHSAINHYHSIIEIRCFICDNSEERAIGILVNGEPCADTYDIAEYNYKGVELHRQRFTDKHRANTCYLNYIRTWPDFKKK
jgi:hypothetical protein